MNLLAVFLAISFVSFVFCDKVCLTGIALSCAEFGSKHIPGTYNKDYTFPTTSEVDYYTGKGMNLFRLPFLWERLQASLNSSFSSQYADHIQEFVTYTTGKGAYVLLDPHNYARYYGKVIGETGTPTASFAEFWGVLADLYKNNSKVIFGIMNEPHGMQTELWLSDANAAIQAIRATGAKNLITVPGNGWTGAHSWNSSSYGTPNSEVMKGVKDPENNYIIEVHQYLDSDSSGSHNVCVSATVGSERLSYFTSWARENKVKAILGEFAGARNEVCYEAITDMFNYMEANTDVWMAFSWWAGGPWWGDYMFTLDPDNGQDRPQMKYVQPHLNGLPVSCV